MHEREIRKAKPPFDILLRKDVRESFMEDINQLVTHAKFTLVASVILKDKLEEQYHDPDNPYHLAMQFGIERVAKHLKLSETSPRLHVICERRGQQEDDDLELAFRRTCDNNIHKFALPMKIVFANKGNYCGLELADLVARPIGRHVLKPDQANRAYEVLETKFRRSAAGKIEGWGLKCFP